jgi:ABC-type amino acid transport substrate-binding protein
MKLGSPLRKNVDQALLQLRESGRYDALKARYFAKPTGDGG